MSTAETATQTGSKSPGVALLRRGVGVLVSAVLLVWWMWAPVSAQPESNARPGARQATAGITAWTWRGPSGVQSPVGPIAVHPTDGGRMWIGSPATGLWTSRDGGVTWTSPLSVISNLAVSAIAIQPDNPNILYAGINQAGGADIAPAGTGIFKSTDGGVSWFPLASTLDADLSVVHRLAVSADSTTLLAVTGTGVFRSADAGVTFTRVLDGLQMTGVVFDPRDPGRALVSGLEGTAWSSADGGLTWTSATGLPGGYPVRVDLAYAPSASGVVLASVGVADGALYRSMDGGATWALVPGAMPPAPVRSLAVNPSSSSWLYAGTNRGLFVSEDGGTSWSAVQDGPGSFSIDQLVIRGGRLYVSTDDQGIWTTELAPPAATLIAPTGNVTTATPQFRWNAVADSTWYQLWIDHDGTRVFNKWYTAVEVNCASGTGECSITSPVSLAFGNHTWWIQTWNTQGYGPWSTGMNFAVLPVSPPPAATLIAPTGSVTTRTPQFRWNAVAGVTWYQLWINQGSSMLFSHWYTASQVGCMAGTGECSLSSPVTFTNQTYKWWVQTYNGWNGPWSTALTFTVNTTPPAAATLVAPSGIVSTTQPQFQWNAVPTSTWYQLWIKEGTTNRFSKWYTAAQAGCPTSPGLCTLASPITLANGQSHTWWIQTWNVDGGYGAWSAGLNFTPTVVPSAATLVSPSGVVSVSQPQFRWNAVTGVSWYLLSVTQGTTSIVSQWYTASQVACAAGTGECVITSPQVLSVGSYSWRVQTWNGVYGPWSAALGFTFGFPPPAPTLIAPSGTAYTTHPRFRWNAATGATYYLVHVDREGVTVFEQLFSATVTDCPGGTGECSLDSPVALTRANYSWQVQGTNGVDGPWSSALAFNVDAVSTDAILAFGDSITAGVVPGATSLGTVTLPIEAYTTGYPQRLQSLLRARFPNQVPLISVTNSGVPGECAAFPCAPDYFRGEDRLGQVLQASQDLVILLEGVNDTNNTDNMRTIQDALTRMVHTIKAANKPIIFCTLTPVYPDATTGLYRADPAKVSNLNDRIRSVAAEEGVVLVDMFYELDSSQISSDGLHPNDAGYQRMAQVLYNAIMASF